ncbi:MAG: 3-phosphoshikimate 1-carboxyvinyltransferase [Desulfofustis sp.]|nr:3-phosphoshikimate 1-carboxyvinyltransferase [Desulfofustis sp.]
MIEIKPVEHIDAVVTIPGSKSITQRALITAALADGASTLHGPLVSEDTDYSSAALQQMGIDIDKGTQSWRVSGTGGRISEPDNDIYLGNNGTATRFLTSVASLGTGEFIIDGDVRMRERPIGPLMAALKGWGVDIESIADTGCPPLSIIASGLRGGKTVLPEGKSSQYLSSLLLVAPYAERQAELQVDGEIISKPYVAMTLEVMATFGVEVGAAADFSRFTIPGGCYLPCDYHIEGDASNASYFWAAAAVSGGSVTVNNVPVLSLQGDTMLVPLLARMGSRVEQQGRGIKVVGPQTLESITADMGDMPDVVPTLAVVAAFAEGASEISNIAHLRVKECDRLSATTSELRKLGVAVDEFDDRMVIHGRGGAGMHGAEIETYEDHRMAMSMAVAGLRVKGVKILNENCVVKSFPDFWECFARLY